MRAGAPALGAALAAALALAPAFAAAPAGPPDPRPSPLAIQGFLYTRSVGVPARGWVQVPLDLTTLRHLGAGGSAESADLRVFGPGGSEVASRVVPYMALGERRDATVLELQPEPGGWAITFDLGPSPPPHERLIFDFVRLAQAPEVRLEASADRQAWEPLAAGDLFQIGSGGGLRRTALVYPPSDRRYLRLHWPQEARFPEVRRVEVETVPHSSLAVTARAAACDRRPPDAIVCRLPLPAGGQILRQLTINLVGEGSVGYRLYEPHQSQWRPLGEGVFQGVGHEARLSLPFEPRPIAGDLLRLELYGVPAPALKSFAAELAVETVVFAAAGPGVYVLAYGGGAGEPRALAGLPVAADEVAWLAPGPELEHPPPPLPPAAIAPGNPIGETRFAASFKVIASGVQPGSLVRLELPAAVYAYARPDLADLRLMARRRQIPYLRWTPPAPAVVVDRAGLKAWPMSRRDRGTVSRLDLELPHSGQPLSQLLLTAPASPLRRAFAVRYIEPSRPAAEGTERVEAQATWECLPHPPLPCRSLLALSAPAPAHLDLRFEDRDNPPLANLGIEIVRRGDVLVFAWPQGDVSLLAGARRLTAPDYDVEALRDQLLARPWRPAEIDLSGKVAPSSSRWTPWLMPLTLLVAAAFLLLLLRRVLAGV